MKYYKKRIVDDILIEKLQSKGVVVIEGPKWCGKTTTAKQVASSILKVDDPIKRNEYIKMADINPQLLLEGETPRLIDEWQLIPKIWDAARYEIDNRESRGQFIFTGSSVPPNSDDITHSGTGRFTWLTMRPMSLYESGESTGDVKISDLFNGVDNISGKNNLSFNQIAYLICRGGWPDSLDLNEKLSLMQAYDYYDAVVRSDINRVDKLSKNPERTKRIMKSLARNQGAQFTNTMIRDDIIVNDSFNISEDTISLYTNALSKIFVIEDMPAWNPNLRSKTPIRTSNTRYFIDPSIAVAALGISPNDLINDLNTMGLFFETMCVRDLRVYADSIDGQLYHYRDKSGLECDTIMHLRNGKYGLIEIKLGGEKLIEEGAKNIKNLVDKIDTNKTQAPTFSMILTGIGDYAYKREDGIFVVPIGCLKN